MQFITNLINSSKAEMIKALIAVSVIKVRFHNLDTFNKAIAKLETQYKKAELIELIQNNSKKFSMGKRTGNYYLGTKVDTHAGNVAKLICQGIIRSKADIRKHYTKKYTFNQTLGRLYLEGIIVFTSDKFDTFELTSKGNELVNMYNAR